jgi:hypothetical protein
MLTPTLVLGAIWRSTVRAPQSPPQDAKEAGQTTGEGGPLANDNTAYRPSADFEALIKAISVEGRANRAEEKREDRGKTRRERATIFLLALTCGAILWQVHEMIKVYGPIKDQADAAKLSADAAKVASEAATAQGAAMTSQSEVAKSAAETAQQNMVAAQRAWVGPVSARLDGVLTKGHDIDIVITYVNTGREPARALTSTTDQFVADVKDNETLSKRVDNDLAECEAASGVAATEVVYPAVGLGGGNERRVTIHGEDVDDDLISGGKAIILPGCFTYLTFSEVRHSAYCFFYKANQTKTQQFNYCAAGGYAD